MLAEPKLKVLVDLVKSSSKEELVWMNGYLAGALLDDNDQGLPAVLQQPAAIAPPAVQKITIAYGTETGNSKKLAQDFAAKAKKNGINAKLVSMDQYRLNDLPKEEYLFTIISTHGEGEPPAAAKKFYDHVHRDGLKLEKLKFGVLALGDTSYPLYCKAGEDVDNQLQRLGGQRIVTLQKCDVDYEADAGYWISEVLKTLSAPISSNSNGAVIAAPVATKKSTGKKLYPGTVLTNINLNDTGSDKETHHLEIAAEELEYEPGDSIGVVAENPLGTIEVILKLTGIDRNKTIVFRNESYTVFDLLKKKLNLLYLPERVVKQYAAIVRQEIPSTKISLPDLLYLYPVKDAEQFEEVINILEPITPRLYSISSSLQAQADEVHVTVAKDVFFVNDERRCGLCSDYLLQMPENTTFQFYVQKNNLFRLPPPGKDIIMIGPGTGIAPFRAFLQERDATGATGKNWLFFGEQHFQTDFLYQTEIQNWVETGLLTKVSLAFSRDQEFKIYVQHRLLQYAVEIGQWIQNGAYIYICGAKEPMSKDVEHALLQIIERVHNKTSTEAIAYLDEMKAEGRYMKDVY